MNNLNDPLYVAAVNNARRSEQRGIELEEMARDARRNSGQPQRPGRVARLVLAAWTHVRQLVSRLVSRPVNRRHPEPETKVVVS